MIHHPVIIISWFWLISLLILENKRGVWRFREEIFHPLLICVCSFWLLQICYFFYKNITFGFTLFWFEAHNSFSGLPAYNDWYMSCYNVFFTSLPVIALGVFDQDVSARLCLKVYNWSILKRFYRNKINRKISPQNKFSEIYLLLTEYSSKVIMDCIIMIYW